MSSATKRTATQAQVADSAEQHAKESKPSESGADLREARAKGNIRNYEQQAKAWRDATLEKLGRDLSTWDDGEFRDAVRRCGDFGNVPTDPIQDKDRAFYKALEEANPVAFKRMQQHYKHGVVNALDGNFMEVIAGPDLGAYPRKTNQLLQDLAAEAKAAQSTGQGRVFAPGKLMLLGIDPEFTHSDFLVPMSAREALGKKNIIDYGQEAKAWRDATLEKLGRDPSTWDNNDFQDAVWRCGNFGALFNDPVQDKDRAFYKALEEANPVAFKRLDKFRRANGGAGMRLDGDLMELLAHEGALEGKWHCDAGCPETEETKASEAEAETHACLVEKMDMRVVLKGVFFNLCGTKKRFGNIPVGTSANRQHFLVRVGSELYAIPATDQLRLHYRDLRSIGPVKPGDELPPAISAFLYAIEARHGFQLPIHPSAEVTWLGNLVVIGYLDLSDESNHEEEGRKEADKDEEQPEEEGSEEEEDPFEELREELLTLRNKHPKPAPPPVFRLSAADAKEVIYQLGDGAIAVAEMFKEKLLARAQDMVAHPECLGSDELQAECLSFARAFYGRDAQYMIWGLSGAADLLKNDDKEGQKEEPESAVVQLSPVEEDE
jgi:hypothetical protein